MIKSLLKTCAACFIAGIGTSSAAAAAGEAADWYFAGECNSWAVNESSQFKTTDTDGVYLLEDFNLAGSTTYKITNAAWSQSYGWTDGGSVAEVDVAYPLGLNAAGNGWCGLSTGTYDITFNQNDATIMFSLSDTQQEIEAEWYITGSFNSWALSTKFVKQEGSEDIYTLDALTITEEAFTDDYWTFVIAKNGWSETYVCAENVDVADQAYTFALRTDDAITSYSHLPLGTYTAEWNATDLTLKIGDPNGASVILVGQDSSAQKEYYTIQGVKVNARNLMPGIYIVKEGNSVKKVYIR